MIFAYDKDRIYFGSNLYSFEGEKCRYMENPYEENMPFWHPHEGMVIEVRSANARILDLIRYTVKVPQNLTFESVQQFQRDVRAMLEKNGYEKDAGYSYMIVLADARDVYYLYDNGLLDRDDKLTPVSGDCQEVLCERVSRDLSPVERIKAYFKLENDYRIKKETPIFLFNTAEPGFRSSTPK